MEREDSLKRYVEEKIEKRVNEPQPQTSGFFGSRIASLITNLSPENGDTTFKEVVMDMVGEEPIQNFGLINKFEKLQKEKEIYMAEARVMLSDISNEEGRLEVLKTCLEMIEKRFATRKDSPIYRELYRKTKNQIGGYEERIKKMRDIEYKYTYPPSISKEDANRVEEFKKLLDFITGHNTDLMLANYDTTIESLSNLANKGSQFFDSLSEELKKPTLFLETLKHQYDSVFEVECKVLLIEIESLASKYYIPGDKHRTDRQKYDEIIKKGSDDLRKIFNLKNGKL